MPSTFDHAAPCRIADGAHGSVLAHMPLVVLASTCAVRNSAPAVGQAGCTQPAYTVSAASRRLTSRQLDLNDAAPRVRHQMGDMRLARDIDKHRLIAEDLDGFAIDGHLQTVLQRVPARLRVLRFIAFWHLRTSRTVSGVLPPAPLFLVRVSTHRLAIGAQPHLPE